MFPWEQVRLTTVKENGSNTPSHTRIIRIYARTAGGTDRYSSIYTSLENHIHMYTQTHAHTGSETDRRKKASYTSTYRVIISTK